MPEIAAGVLLVARTTERVLLLDRSDGRGWCQPGGMSESGEEPSETALRELEEETGVSPRLRVASVLELAVSNDGTIDVVDRLPRSARLIYVLFVAWVAEEFEPVLNDEHRGFTWADLDDLGPHLHPGTLAALEYLDARTCRASGGGI